MIQPKYEIGEKVFSVHVNWTSIEVICPDCLGMKTWVVMAASGESWKVPCNTCNKGYFSSGTVSEWNDRLIIDQVTVGSIKMDTADVQNPIRYMCDETGIGSGRVYDEKQLFKTKKEADEWGDKELERVRGIKQEQELAISKRRKTQGLYKTKEKK